MSQKPLFDPGPPDGKLTDRQAFALEQLRRTPGLNRAEVGALLHERAGKHGAGTRCDWCAATGGEVLKALRKKGLVRSSRSGEWRALHGEESQAVEGYDPATAPIPF